MIAVSTLPSDMKRQIDLGRSKDTDRDQFAAHNSTVVVIRDLQRWRTFLLKHDIKPDL